MDLLSVFNMLEPQRSDPRTSFDVAAESNPNLREGATRMETLTDVKLVEPEPDYRVSRVALG